MKRTLTLAALFLLTVVAYAQYGNPAEDVPAYNAAPPSRALPQVMHGDQLKGESFTHVYQVRAYQMAKEVPNVLHQLPCYCRCDRSMGHNSLHSCFEGTHGAACSTCMKEGVYAYQQTKKGKTVSQIRAGVERGEWMNVDLEQVK